MNDTRAMPCRRGLEADGHVHRVVHTRRRHGSRHGGTIPGVVNDLSHAADAVLICDKVHAALAGPHLVAGHELRLAASLGISIFPDDGDDAETLIHLADAAMYRAKRARSGQCVFHGKLVAPGDARSHGPAPPAIEEALARHERVYADLREANQQLLLAALSAQEMQAAAERAQQRQTEFLACWRTSCATRGAHRHVGPCQPRQAG